MFETKRINSILLAFLIVASCTYMRETPSYREHQHQERRSPSPSPDAPASGFYPKYSQKLGYQLNGTENRELIQEVASWLGTPYKYGGSTKAGADCSGFVQSIYKKVYGIDLARVSASMAQNSQRVNNPSRLREGDLVFFRISGRRISHVGIYISNNKFIHASTSRGVIVNDLDESYYKQRFAFGGRVRK